MSPKRYGKRYEYVDPFISNIVFLMKLSSYMAFSTGWFFVQRLSFISISDGW